MIVTSPAFTLDHDFRSQEVWVMSPAPQPTVWAARRCRRAMQGRRWDSSTPVLRPAANGRVAEMIFDIIVQPEWYRRLNECVEAGELPFENGLGPLHSLVMEQGKQFQREGWPRKLEQDSKLTGSQIAVVTLLAPTIPIGATAIAGGYLALLPVYAMTGGSRRKAQAVTDTLLDSDSSYGAFIAALGEPDRQISKGSYSINQYPATVRISEGLSCYHLGLKNGRVVWAADVRDVDLTKIDEYRKAHGLP